ncbi:thioredoxin fold domain-containing protein [bacterium]|nr:thioredoxin fold domain-containing protein [bacterium]
MFKFLRSMTGFLVVYYLCVTTLAFAGTQTIEWLKFDEGYNKVFSDKKPMMVYFNTKACGWCRKMESNTFGDPAIANTMKEKFVLSNVDLRSFKEIKWKGETFTERDIAQIFQIVGVPCVAFVDTVGQFIIKIPGYIPPENFQYILKYVSGYWYEDLTFEEFMKTEEMLNADPIKR